MQELTEEEQMSPKNKTGKARNNPDQQPSLLEQLEFDEEPGHEGDPHREESSGEAGERYTGEPAPESANSHPGADGDLDEQIPEPLAKAYARYVEVINETYDSRFSGTKRQAAFKEAAKAHGVRITDLKRYSTATALGIPYQSSAETDSEVGEDFDASQTD